MLLQTTQFIQILLFCVIAGQAFFYFIGGTAALKNVSATAFIEQRKAIDTEIAPYLKVIYPLTIVISIAMLVLLRQQLGSALFMLSAAACLLVVIDLAIAMKGNIPLNQRISTWPLDAYPGNWHVVRDRWLTYMHYRQFCDIAGLLCLLVGIIWKA